MKLMTCTETMAAVGIRAEQWQLDLLRANGIDPNEPAILARDIAVGAPS